MKSKTFSGRSLRSSLKGSTWILVLLLLGFMVAFPVAELMLIGNQTDEIHRMTFAMICSYLIVPGFLVTMLAAVVNALNEFWYLFSRDKIDFYHSWGSCQGVIGENEVLISTGTRNFKGRAGHPSSKVYLGSAATVTASAITGKIALASEV